MSRLKSRSFGLRSWRMPEAERAFFNLCIEETVKHTVGFACVKYPADCVSLPVDIPCPIMVK